MVKDIYNVPLLTLIGTVLNTMYGFNCIFVDYCLKLYGYGAHASKLPPIPNFGNTMSANRPAARTPSAHKINNCHFESGMISKAAIVFKFKVEVFTMSPMAITFIFFALA